MPAATARPTPVDALMRKAPSAMPGQSLYPKSRSAASAIPVGGHTRDTLLCMGARDNPSFAAAT